MPLDKGLVLLLKKTWAVRDMSIIQDLWHNARQLHRLPGTFFSSVGQGSLSAYSLALTPALKNWNRLVLIPQNLEQIMVFLNKAGDTAKKFYHSLQQGKALKISYSVTATQYHRGN